MAALSTMNAAPRGVKRAYLDSSVFIDYAAANPRSVRPLKTLFELVRTSGIEAVASTAILPEVLPLDPMDAQILVREALLKLVQIVPVSEEIGWEAARLRFDYRLLTPDALHVATASREGCQALITADAADLERTGGLPLSGGAGNLRIIVSQRLPR